MKKISGVLFIFLSLVLIFCFSAAPCGEKDKDNALSEEITLPVSEITKVKDEEPVEKYEITMSGTDIYVYKIEEEEKIILKKAAASLPRKSDIERLRQGIEAKTLEDALLIFEDFIS